MLKLEEKLDCLVLAKEIDSLLFNTFEDVAKNFINIGGHLNNIKENEYYILLDYSDIYSYSFDRFKLSKTATKNFINLFRKFGEEIFENEYDLKDEFKEYSYSQLVELVSLPEEKLIEYSPSLTIKEIRSLKKIDSLESQLKSKLFRSFKYFYNTFLDCKSILNDFTFSPVDIESIELDDSGLDLYIPVNFKFINNKYSANFNLRTYFKDDLIYNSIYFDFRKLSNYSDVDYLSFDYLVMNEFDFCDDLMNYFSLIKDKIFKFEEQIKNSKSKIIQDNHQKERDDLKGRKIYKIEDLNDLSVQPSSAILSFFKLILLNNNLKKEYIPYLCYTGSKFEIIYENLRITYDYYYFLLYYNNEAKYFSIKDLIDLIYLSNGVFYPIDLINYAKSPTSD